MITKPHCCVHHILALTVANDNVKASFVRHIKYVIEWTQQMPGVYFACRTTRTLSWWCFTGCGHFVSGKILTLVNRIVELTCLINNGEIKIYEGFKLMSTCSRFEEVTRALRNTLTVNSFTRLICRSQTKRKDVCNITTTTYSSTIWTFLLELMDQY